MKHYEALADVFRYPDARWLGHVLETVRVLGQDNPRAADELGLFLALMPNPDPDDPQPALDQLRELFTRTFEVQAATTLDIGYVAFGDDYKRAELLVNLSREHELAGVDCGTELPDHLPNLLRLIARSSDRPMVAELVSELLAPALRSMCGDFNVDAMAARDKLYKKHLRTLIETDVVRAVAWKHALRSLLYTLERDFELSTPPPENRATSAFLRFIRHELAIEARKAGRKPSGRTP